MNPGLPIIGAVAGGVLALLLTVAFDPAEGTGPDSYENGSRAGLLIRYMALGAFAGLALERIRSNARHGHLWGLGLVVAAALIVIPATMTVTEGGADERFRTSFVRNCIQGAGEVPSDMAEQMCGCSYDQLSARYDRDEIVAIDRQIAENPSAPAPAAVEAVINTCWSLRP